MYVYDNTIFLKWGILNVPFCSIFQWYHFIFILLSLTLVVPCLHNMFMVLLILHSLGNITIGARKPIFLHSGPKGGRGGGGFVRAWAWFVLIV